MAGCFVMIEEMKLRKRKSMLKRFYPDEEINSVYELNFQSLYDEGYRGVIFDIDNTLVPHGAPADEQAVALFNTLRDVGFQSMLLSNNKEPRVKMFNDKVNIIPASRQAHSAAHNILFFIFMPPLFVPSAQGRLSNIII